MASLLLPVFLFLLLGLGVLGLVLAGQRPVRTWGQWLKELAHVAREPEEKNVRVVSQSVSLEDLMVRDEGSAYMGTESFQGLVTAVDRALVSAEAGVASRRAPRAQAKQPRRV